MEIFETFYPKAAIEWREWLFKHHDRKKEIWVTLYKKYTRKQTVTYQEALDEALCFGWIDGIEKRIDEKRYALRFTPRSTKSNWSKTNITRFKELLKENRADESGKNAFERKSR